MRKSGRTERSTTHEAAGGFIAYIAFSFGEKDACLLEDLVDFGLLV